jgi:hypothetical protein
VQKDYAIFKQRKHLESCPQTLKSLRDAAKNPEKAGLCF